MGRKQKPDDPQSWLGPEGGEHVGVANGFLGAASKHGLVLFRISINAETSNVKLRGDQLQSPRNVRSAQDRLLGLWNSRICDIFLRKEESSAMISAMRNSIAESSATAPTNPYDPGAMRAFATRTGFQGAGKNFV
jgi:hypothetical protein